MTFSTILGSQFQDHLSSSEHVLHPTSATHYCCHNLDFVMISNCSLSIIPISSTSLFHNYFSNSLVHSVWTVNSNNSPNISVSKSIDPNLFVFLNILSLCLPPYLVWIPWLVIMEISSIRSTHLLLSCCIVLTWQNPNAGSVQLSTNSMVALVQFNVLEKSRN